jgi:hypothetical protein
MRDRTSDVEIVEPVVAVQRSLGDLFGELSQEFSNLIHQELQLAKAELRDEAAGGHRHQEVALLGAGLAAALAVAFLGVALACGLAQIVPVGWAFFVVGLAFGGAAWLLYRRVAAADTDPDAGDELAPARVDRVDGHRL